MNFSCFASPRAAAGVLALVLSTSATGAQTGALSTAPYGVMSLALPKASRGLAFPLPAQDLYLGRVAANTASALTLTPESADVRVALEDAGPCYVEVLSGPWEGERFDLDVPATQAGSSETLVLLAGAGSHSTVTLAAEALADALVVVRPHVTLATLQTMLTPALVGSNSPGKADGVRLFEAGQWVQYTLRADGKTWLRANGSTDQAHMVIPPDTSVILDLRSGAKSWLHHGVVRTNAFRKNLVTGPQAFASGFPVDLTPAEIGAFVDPQQPTGIRWTGAENFDQADSFERQAASGSTASNRYHLRANGTSWRRMNVNTDVTQEPFIATADAWLLRRKNADPGYVIPVPLAP